MECCSPFPDQAPYAKHFHPVDGRAMCVDSARWMVIMEENDAKKKFLKRHFGFRKDMILRAERLFYYELVKRVPALREMERVLDETVMSRMFGKAKCVSDPRPDYFHYNRETNTALLGEFDETDDHEEGEDRLRVIAHHAGCGRGRMFVFRVKAGLDTDDPVCERRVLNRNQVMMVMTRTGHRMADRVADYIHSCLCKMRDGIIDDPKQMIFR